MSDLAIRSVYENNTTWLIHADSYIAAFA